MDALAAMSDALLDYYESNLLSPECGRLVAPLPPPLSVLTLAEIRSERERRRQ